MVYAEKYPLTKECWEIPGIDSVPAKKLTIPKIKKDKYKDTMLINDYVCPNMPYEIFSQEYERKSGVYCFNKKS